MALVCFLLFFCLFSNRAQTIVKLPTDSIIGTELSIDYQTNSPSTTVNTKSNVFDGNLETFFSSYERSGGWVGLDLRDKYIITKIAYAPRFEVSGPTRLLLGIIEGANNADFSDAIPLFIISELVPPLMMKEQEINCSRGFRYVRYVGPINSRCNIAELEFYGYKGAGNNSRFPQLTNLPTVSISTENAEDIVDKDTYLKGFISIINNGTIYSDLLEIRGRGHASWNFPKKPYRIKLRNKANVLGLPSRDRHWTLVNNYGDKTLLRNLLAADLSKRLEMAYTPACQPVDVILNGEYKGTYNLCDHIRIAEGRVEIQELTPNDITLPKLSGGYLLEVDGYAESEDDGWFLSATRRTPVKIRNIDTDVIMPQQYFYIRDHYNKMETSVLDLKRTTPIADVRKYIDTESFIRYFLLGEIFGNRDTYWSVYMAKDRNKDFFTFGPVWDIDLGFDNDNRCYPVNEKKQWIYEIGSTAQGFKTIVTQLITNEMVFANLKQTYIDYRESGALTVNKMIKVIDSLSAVLNQSQRLNFLRWNILNTVVHLNPQALGSYDEEVKNVKRYISERIPWIDNKFNYINVSHTPEITALSKITISSYANTICINQVSEPALITITDIVGRVVFSKLIRENASIPVDKGFYFITIADPKGKVKTVKCLIG